MLLTGELLMAGCWTMLRSRLLLMTGEVCSTSGFLLTTCGWILAAVLWLGSGCHSSSITSPEAGSMVPVLPLFPFLTLETLESHCTTTTDGFYYMSVAWVVLGCVWLVWGRRTLGHMQNLEVGPAGEQFTT